MNHPERNMVSRSERSVRYLQHLVDSETTNPGLKYQLATGFKGIYLEMAKLELCRRGQKAPPLTKSNFQRSISRVTERLDCADFVIPAFLIILSRYKGCTQLPDELYIQLEDAVLGYKYWIDEPGEEINHTCFFTENHQALFHSIEYIAGTLYPDRIFSNNGQTGAWHREHGLSYLQRWLTWRIRFGFSEWLSNEYYAEDLVAMLLIMELAPDARIKKQAEMIIDLLLFDLALHSCKGVFGATSGRMYNWGTINPDGSEMNAVAQLQWGLGVTDGSMSLPAVLMAVLDYECAEVIKKVALDKREETEIRQRMSFNVEDSYRYGIDPKDYDNIMLFWSMHTFFHRMVIENSRKFTPAWYDKDTAVEAFLEHYRLMDAANTYTDPDPNSSALTQADIYTYKTPHYMLSCVQDYRKGRTNFQQHIWQATLGGRALVFVTNPGASDYTGRPNYFVGNGYMPKVNACKNVLIAIYRIPPEYKFLCTHAYFPVHEFDEFEEKNGWLFGRKGDGYIALRSLKGGGVWREKAPDLFQSIYHDTWKEEYEKAENYEYLVSGHANVWICEMGDPKTHGSFQMFVSAISNALVKGDTFSVRYHSPTLGTVESGWLKPFTVNGKPIPVKDYMRYDTPYCKAEFDTKLYQIENEGQKLILNFDTMERITEK